MKIEDQVTSLPLAKRLKELGVKQESYFHWLLFTSGKPPEIHHAGFLGFNDDEKVSAFTVAEMGEMLPNRVMSSKVRSRSWNCRYDDASSTAKTEADAWALLLIHLIEKKLVKP